MSSPLLIDMIFIDRITGYTGWKRKFVIPSPEASGRDLFMSQKTYRACQERIQPRCGCIVCGVCFLCYSTALRSIKDSSTPLGL